MIKFLQVQVYIKPSITVYSLYMLTMTPPDLIILVSKKKKHQKTSCNRKKKRKNSSERGDAIPGQTDVH